MIAEQSVEVLGEHLTADGRLADILDNPAFAGFAERILPWAGRRYDPAMPLGQMASLLPYHSAVDTGTVVAALNRMIDDAGAGQTVFYDIYSEAERRADPAKAATGLFFYRGRPGAPFAVIAPGGGFSYVGSVHEGFPYAEAISDLGLNAFVLTYRAGQGGQVATEDLAAAITWIFRNAEELGVGTDGYSLWGSSAGARMAAYIGSHGPAAFGGANLPKPAAVVMAYTSHSDLAETEPPTFVVVGERDGIAPPGNMERRIAALRRIGTPVEYHLFPNVGHGFGAGTGTSAEGWIAEAVRFWRQQL
ncbi:alpha/beta hydrolase [Paracoccus denitrificans]|nr:alpha/beta hydrolase [Paracoccus denitrificans]MBB4629942.1 acetyl esterase/lipase [Paracoccus denitrificans]MCU7431329.1 alpha/beta hydrolase [Paracoccus denitrificans]QAR27948.1 alpha/beta hydrolase [Paracoccus denitrificans]UPV97664.1 alpha/beta hydrolase [Paracoccus denitrificans]WQO35578.1 alpha/beta hydrolase [Paracoccus denitrificans]